MKLGFNLPAVSAAGRERPFANLMLSRSPWYNVTGDTPATLDGNGEPIGDCRCYIVEGSDADMVLDGKVILGVPAGDYDLTFYGTAEISGNFTVVNQYVNGGWTQATLRVPPGNISFGISFQKTAAPGPRNIALLMPGYKASDVYNRDLVGLLAQGASFRVMDFMQTNGSIAQNWADRTRPDAWQAGPMGPSWEHVIGLANAAGVDPWINIPHMATDDYVAKLAALFAAGLDPHRAVYVTRSNEGWNTMFPQFGWIQQRARDEQKSGAFDYTYPGDPYPGNDVFWGWRWLARKAVEDGHIFIKALGLDRVRPVYETQLMYPAMPVDAMAFIQAKYGNVRDQIHGIAIAPYLGIPKNIANDPNLTPDGLIAALRSSLPGLDPQNQRVLKTCTDNGIKLLAYELGTDTDDTDAAIPAKVLAQNYPGMRDVVRELLVESAKSIDLANYYTLSGPFGKDGTWPLTNRFLAPAPKLDAALAFAAANNGTTPPTPAPTPTPAPPVSPQTGRKLVSVSTTYTYDDKTTETITR